MVTISDEYIGYFLLLTSLSLGCALLNNRALFNTKAMFRLRTLVTLLMSLNLTHSSASEEAKSNRGAVEEYCQYESFQPQCLTNEVIAMQSATYGRMRIGRCVTAEEVEAHRSAVGDDTRYFGCSEDVLSIMDQRCSGKVKCEVRVINLSLVEKMKPCFPGLNVNLEVSFDCINVADEEHSCSVTASIVPTHIIGSLNGSKQICGTKLQPWTIEAPVGQKIRISLLDFRASKSDRDQFQQLCHRYGVIVDKGSKQNVTICGGGGQREKELYTSTGNAADIIFKPSDPKERNVDVKLFMLKLTAVGCLDLIPPEDAWLKRNDDFIVIGCYSSRQTWHLHCEGEKWIGVFGNCSQAQDTAVESEIVQESWNNERVLTMVAVGGFLLTICLAVLCTGIVCLRRFSAKGKKKQDYNTLTYQMNSSQRLQRDQGMSIGLTNDVIGNDARRMNMQQAPTYSVFVGESGYNDAENRIS